MDPCGSGRTLAFSFVLATTNTTSDVDANTHYVLVSCFIINIQLLLLILPPLLLKIIILVVDFV